MEKRKNFILLFPVLVIGIILAVVYISFLHTKKHSIRIENMDREYLVHLPPAYKKSEKIPMVIALHGYSDNPRLMELYTGLSRKADKEGFMVVYPYGTKSSEDKNLSWNGGSCCGNGVLSDVQDVSFINGLTDELIKNYKVDPKNVYLVGFSNGALLTYRIAAETPERYKAFAGVSGSIGGKVYDKLPEFVISNPKKPVSILMMHGLLDKRIPYNGGENSDKNGSFKSFKDSTDLFKKSSNCSDGVKEETNNFLHEKFDCDTGTKVELYTIKNTGHIWPGGLQDYKNIIKRKTTSANDRIWDFFNK